MNKDKALNSIQKLKNYINFLHTQMKNNKENINNLINEKDKQIHEKDKQIKDLNLRIEFLNKYNLKLDSDFNNLHYENQQLQLEIDNLKKAPSFILL